MSDKKPLIVITGPTAAGKTRQSLSLAKHFDTEIISADSMQVYRGMDIGTAKIKPEEMQGIKHHLIDVLDISENFDAFTFKQMALPVMDSLYDRGRIPLVVGGTGFYIQALCYDTSFSESMNPNIRKRLQQEAESMGPEHLYKRLVQQDPEYAKDLSPNNIKRVIRALEFYESEGYPLSEHNRNERQKESPYDLKYFVLFRERSRLYEDINKRVDIMMEEGFLEEVRFLREKGLKRDSNAGYALGYRELLAHLEGEMELDEAVEKIKQNTRHFAKRQMTWFRRERDVTWVNKDEFADEAALLEYILLQFVTSGSLPRLSFRS